MHADGPESAPPSGPSGPPRGDRWLGQLEHEAPARTPGEALRRLGREVGAAVRSMRELLRRPKDRSYRITFLTAIERIEWAVRDVLRSLRGGGRETPPGEGGGPRESGGTDLHGG